MIGPGFCGGAHPDTIWDFLWKCPHANVVTYMDGLQPVLVARAVKAVSNFSLLQNGSMLDPKDSWPRPPQQSAFHDALAFEVSDPIMGRRYMMRVSGGHVGMSTLSGPVCHMCMCFPSLVGQCGRLSWWW